MELLNASIKNSLANSSMIRRMFEAGLELKQKYGADQVSDFSLGNPDLAPPPEVKKALEKIATGSDLPFSIGYMPNAGYPQLRNKLAQMVSVEQQLEVSGNDLIVTCGAAGALNVIFHSILSAGDKVLAVAPYFVEYDFYVANGGGVLERVPAKDLSFELDIEAFKTAITPEVRAIILNSPNNPTGQIYGRSELEALAEVISEREAEYGHPIFVISDEPYRFLNFDNLEIPGVFGIFKYALVAGSFSKNLSLAGERLGYIAVNPAIENREELVAGLILSNRTLGFVNAPALGQKILLECLDAQVDLEIYRRRRQAMAEVLDNAKLTYTMPKGAFYFFVKSPVADEREFVNALLEEKILAVPGRGFGCPGYIRLTFCVSEDEIRRSMAGFAAAAARFSK